jgi:sulfate transport system substrate-binding protein
MEMPQALSHAKSNKTKHDKITHKWLMYSQMTLYFFMSSFSLYLNNIIAMKTRFLTILLPLLFLLVSCSDSTDKIPTLLNVSYDPTRELYKEINQAFAAQYGQPVNLEQSHGGSGKQARAVIDGLEADVVTLALGYDIDILSTQAKLLPADWQERLPEHSTPYYSTVVFLVRKGNPKGIHDWGDLVKDGVEVITPNPKTSGGARWNYLAAWAWADRQFNHDEAKIIDYMKQLFQHVPVLDTGARGSTLTFAQRAKGDVLLAWENEALLALRDYPKEEFEIVCPSISILAEPSVAIVDVNVEKHGTQQLAKDYLDFLYTPAAQAICAKHFYRASRPQTVDAALLAPFKELTLVNIRDEFGGWAAAHAKHFASDALFDQIMRK